jgi:hypothetical protein
LGLFDGLFDIGAIVLVLWSCLMIRVEKLTGMLIALALGAMLSGCEDIHEAIHGDNGISSDPAAINANQTVEARQAATIETDHFKLFLPEGVVATDVLSEISAAMIYAGEDRSVVSFSDLVERQLAGFVGELDGLSASEMLAAIATDIRSSGQFVLANVSTTQNSDDTIATGNFVVTYLVSGGSEESSSLGIGLTELNNEIASLVLIEDLSLDPSFPVALENDVVSTSFQLTVTVYIKNNRGMVISVLVPETLYDNYVERLANVTDSSNIGEPGDILSTASDSFSAVEAVTLAADFLFVIDNSGSMSAYQDALVNAVETFVAEIEVSALDYELGIITTDSASLVVDGLGTGSSDPFTNDSEEFKARASVGTGGGSAEAGIFYAEEALQSIVAGDPTDGTVTLAGYPRAGATLSTVILSDEPNNYYNAFRGADFDVSDNLFLERGFTVYSIINESAPGQYGDLALATGGSVANIANVQTFPQIMKQIANAAGAKTSPYVLSNKPIAGTIRVLVEGVDIRNGPNGWQYSSVNNAIILRGDAIPAPGASIQIGYSYIESAAL